MSSNLQAIMLQIEAIELQLKIIKLSLGAVQETDEQNENHHIGADFFDDFCSRCCLHMDDCVCRAICCDCGEYMDECSCIDYDTEWDTGAQEDGSVWSI